MKPRFIVEQKITPLINRYAIYECLPDGTKSGLLALAEQKRFAFKEKVTFYADEQKTQVAFTFRAEKVMDIHGRFFVEDAGGQLLGQFKKDFGKSLASSTWNILDRSGNPILEFTEKNMYLAVFRRYSGFIPVVGDIINLVTSVIRYHFIVRTAGSSEITGNYIKTTRVRDQYRLEMADETYSLANWQTFASVAVALDALQGR